MVKFLKLNILFYILVLLTLVDEISYSMVYENPLNKELLAASTRGDADTVRLLLARGAYVDTRDRLGNTPLIIASDNGYQEIVRLLLSKGASINVMNKYGYTPLLSAITNSHRYTARALISSGADPDIPNKYGTTPRMYIFSLGFFTIEEYISNNDPAVSAIIDHRLKRRGTTGYIHNSYWREKFNRLVYDGKSSEAAKLLIKYAEDNNLEAQYLLGMLLMSKNESEKGMKWLRKVVTSNNINYLYGIGITFTSEDNNYDYNFGAEALKKAMDLGNIYAKSRYGICLLFGIGVKKDQKEAYNLFEEASLSGVTEGTFYKGLMYFNGLGIPINESKGIDLIKEAADKNYTPALDFLFDLEAKEVIKKINETTVSERSNIKSYLVSINAILLESNNNKCDSYDISNIIRNIYGIQRLDLCYPGDKSVKIIYYISNYIESYMLDYLKSISPNGIFNDLGSTQ